jgi:hypothetical protein
MRVQEGAVSASAVPAPPEEETAWDEDGYADDVDVWPDTEEDCGCED